MAQTPHATDPKSATLSTPDIETARLKNLQATQAQEVLDKAAAGTHPRKGDTDRAGFDLGGVDGKPTDAGLRDTQTLPGD